jgi:hypothetical protein
MESLKRLQPDLVSRQATLIEQLAIIQMNASATESVLKAIEDSKEFRPSARDIWINGLWLVSLAMTLVLSVVMLLVKHWTHRCQKSPHKSGGDLETEIRGRFRSMIAWGVHEIVEYSPFLLHLSMLLFLIGLSLLIFSINRALTCALAAIAGVAAIVYFIAGFFPLFYPSCPYRTPLTHILWKIMGRVRNFPEHI